MAKISHKTNPIGVRFNKTKLELVQQEQNLATPQKVIDYFLEGYGEESELEKKLQEIFDKSNTEENKHNLIQSLLECGMVITETTENGQRVLAPNSEEWWQRYNELKPINTPQEPGTVEEKEDSKNEIDMSQCPYPSGIERTIWIKEQKEKLKTTS